MSEMVVIIVVAFVVLGVFGRSGRRSPDVSGLHRTIRDLQAQLDAAQADIEQQRLQLAELAERLDFAERRLVQVQTPKPLPPPG